MFEPAYVHLLETGELAHRVEAAYAGLGCCRACGWECRVDRSSAPRGVCHTGSCARLGSYGPHLGEERPLSGWRGSGTVFFARCSLRCQYCQNHPISQGASGNEVTPQELASILLELQDRGCHNINFVTPTHVVAPLLHAVHLAAQAGLRLPLVYNTGGYDSVETLQLLEGVMDIYLPDMKYASARSGLHYSKVRNYPAINQAAVKEMYRQVGNLQCDEHGLARRGLLVRHLVLPHGLAGTAEVVRFLAEEISPHVSLNLMEQYRPEWNARQFPKLTRAITAQEYASALQLAQAAGLDRLGVRSTQ